MRHLSLFSGVGMTDLAAERSGFQTVVTAEIDPFARSVLAKRYPRALHLDNVTKVSDAVGVATAYRLHGIELVSGGFPCQDVSNAGTKDGLHGHRSGLWAEMDRVIGELEPRYVLVENVSALRGRGLNRILNDLWHKGYTARWDCIPAAALGAPHLRDRVWVAAARQDTFVRPVRDVLIGRIGPRDDGITLDGAPVLKLPRAGSMDSMGAVREREPLAPIKACKAFPRPLLGSVAYGAWCRDYLPTPTRADGTGGPGTTPKRTGGMNLRTAVAPGPLNPDWVEWMMGLPQGWTNPELSNDELSPFTTWDVEPRDTPRVLYGKVPHRRKRLIALGNGLVPQVAEYVFRWFEDGGIP